MAVSLLWALSLTATGPRCVPDHDVIAWALRDEDAIQKLADKVNTAATSTTPACGDIWKQAPDSRQARWIIQPDGMVRANPEGRSATFALHDGWKTSAQVKVYDGAGGERSYCGPVEADVVYRLDNLNLRGPTVRLVVETPFSLASADLKTASENLATATVTACLVPQLVGDLRKEAKALSVALRQRLAAFAGGSAANPIVAVDARQALIAAIRKEGMRLSQPGRTKQGATVMRRAWQTLEGRTPTVGFYVDPEADQKALETFERDFALDGQAPKPNLKALRKAAGELLDRRVASALDDNRPYRPRVSVDLPSGRDVAVVDLPVSQNGRTMSRRVYEDQTVLFVARGVEVAQRSAFSFETKKGAAVAPTGSQLTQAVKSFLPYLVNAVVGMKTVETPTPLCPSMEDMVAEQASGALALYGMPDLSCTDAVKKALNKFYGHVPQTLTGKYTTLVHVETPMAADHWHEAKLQRKLSGEKEAKTVARHRLRVRARHRWVSVGAEAAFGTNVPDRLALVPTGGGGADELFVLRDTSRGKDRIAFSALLLFYPFARLPEPAMHGWGFGLGPTFATGAGARVGEQFQFRLVYELPNSGVLLSLGPGISAVETPVDVEEGRVFSVEKPASGEAKPPTLETRQSWLVSYWVGLALDVSIFADAFKLIGGGE